MNTELKNKILYTIFLLFLYRIGTFIFLPGINGEVINDFFNSDTGSVFNLLNMFSGGAFSRMSIFALNIMPYITASIIIQLLASVYKGLEELKKEGEYGRRKMNQYTKYLTLFLAIFQSIGIYYAFLNLEKSAFINNSSMFLWTTVFTLVAGTMILMWVGDKITQNGIGNGISLLIFVGIVAELPSSFVQIFELARKGQFSVIFLLFVLCVFTALIFFIIFMEKATRNIKIQYPNRGLMKSNGFKEDNSHIPLKVNMSGSIPPIFSSSILTFPFIISKLFKGDMTDKVSSFLTKGNLLYMILFSILIIFFSYFYSTIVFNTEDVSENLKKSNCFIPGIRPGTATKEYLDSVVYRITFIGAIYLCIVCLLPEILTTKYSLPLSIGGTGLLILIDVVIDLVTQIQSYMFSNKYNNMNKQRKIRVR